ncbi:DUF6519 domain-containing protein [Microbacterium ureisolvens]|uniref:DUF6519 domain-containing protein n=1 Tax=Microbacterium ureisolvens TaxID=2781186 RepID=UPI00362C126B
MRGDFSRDTFRRGRHYSGVLMQQGRVQLDSDWNEQRSITRHRVEAEAVDVVGPTGAPRERPGFGITPQGGDLLISAGRFYVEGLLCENDEDVLFSKQEDLLPVSGSLLPVPAGLYLAYLEAWEGHVTALEDGAIRETALGGPDTATRARIVWQVKLMPVADPGGTVTGDTPFAEWDDVLSSRLVGSADAGRLAARAQPAPPADDTACVLPPEAGYRRLENQLYRVEVHSGGSRGEARFKWSRDNGTVVSAIEPDGSGNPTSGSQVTVAEIGKDSLLTFATDPLPQWLELSDDRYELSEQRGRLVRVQSVNPATRTITFVPGGLPDLDVARHPLVRRWDQRDGGSAALTPTEDGVPMTGDWQPLEDGVEVRFADGRYLPGDYWLIPARTAIGGTIGDVEWPRAGNAPVLRERDGTPHHLARLALLRSDGASFTAVPDGDSRPVFPPLTAIAADDVRFSDPTGGLAPATTVQEAIEILSQRNGSMCSLLVGPEEDLATALGRLPANPPAGPLDALICLRIGTYRLAEPLRIQGRGHIQFVGAGPGTRIEAPASEAALQFVGCASVRVSNLSVSTGVAGRGSQRLRGLNGAITFVDCPSVTVDAVTARCSGGPLRAASCVTVRNAPDAANTSVTVHGSTLEVGHLQIGVLLVNVTRIRVDDNVIRAGSRPPDGALLNDVDFRAVPRRQLLTGIVTGSPGLPAPPDTNVTITFGGHQVHARSHPALQLGNRDDSEWSRAINALAPARITGPVELKRWLTAFAGSMVRTRGTGDGGTPNFRAVISSLLSQEVAAGQGIVVAGRIAGEVLVQDNSLTDVIEGIHIGLSGGEERREAGIVRITDNTIRLRLPTSAKRERHAILSGNCDSLVVEGNFASIVRDAGNATLRVEGIRVFGTLGRRVIVRHNHLGSGFTIGVTFAPLNAPPLPTQPLWVITENVMESVAAKVDVPARTPSRPGASDPAVVRGKVRGLADNFA